GRLQVQLLDGTNGAAYAWKDVTLQEVLPDGKYKWSGIYRTDGSGHLRLDPTDLGRKSYAISAPSPVDGTEKYSATYADAGTYQFRVGNVGLAVQLLDDVTGAGIANVEIHAYERMADGSEAWKAKHVSDAGGRVSFDLEGLGAGRTYFARAKPFGMWVSSAPITRTGWFGFTVGRLQVQVIDGRTGLGSAGQSITLKRWQPDGNHQVVMTAVTDGSGWVKLDPGGVGTEPYVVSATSPTDGYQKVSDKYLSKGPHRFVLGNEPVIARVVDGRSGAALAEKWVEAWEVLADGQKALRHKRWTDASGQVRFDLDGIQSGRRYVLRAQPYLNTVESGPIGAAGEIVLQAGRLQVQLLDGTNGAAYAWKDVTLQEVLPDGKYKWSGIYRTDGSGHLRLDPTDLGRKSYAISAPSPVDGTEKYSATYADAGTYQFRVGNVGLAVQLLDDVTGAGIANVEIHAYERMADGSEAWKAKHVSDAGGRVSFDLEGLGAGRTYFARAKPFGMWVSSAPITRTGWFGF
ncbi:hypothetical protein, partial [Methyloversatilis universalis]|uniref:hypothetical protein n=1 Tax=Methyloversatilis universalis TaxID=378211 RepID=UPI0005BBD7FF